MPHGSHDGLLHDDLVHLVFEDALCSIICAMLLPGDHRAFEGSRVVNDIDAPSTVALGGGAISEHCDLVPASLPCWSKSCGNALCPWLAL